MLNSTPTSKIKVRIEGSKILSIPFTLWDGVHMGVGVNCVCAHVQRAEFRTGVIPQALTTLCFGTRAFLVQCSPVRLDSLT